MVYVAAAADDEKEVAYVQQDEVRPKTTHLVKQRNWTPLAIRLPFLLSIIVFLQFCTAGLELLLRNTRVFQPQSTASVQKRQESTATGADGGCTVIATTFTTYAWTSYVTVNGTSKRAIADTGTATATGDVQSTVTQVQGDPTGVCVTITTTSTLTEVYASTVYGSLANVDPNSNSASLLTPTTSTIPPPETDQQTAVSPSDVSSVLSGGETQTPIDSPPTPSSSIDTITVYSSVPVPWSYNSSASVTASPTPDVPIVTSQVPTEVDYGSLTSITSTESAAPPESTNESPTSLPGQTSTITTTLSLSTVYTAEITTISELATNQYPTEQTSISLPFSMPMAIGSTLSTIKSPNTFKPVTGNLASITDSSTTPIASTTTSSSSTASSLPNRIASTTFAKHDLQVTGTFQQVWYFAAMYLPAIVSVMIKELWAEVGASAKLMEPFYRLNRDIGATFAESLCSEYLASTMSWNSLKDAFTGNLILLLVIFGNVAVSLLAPLATESMTFIYTAIGVAKDGSPYWGSPVWLVSSSLVRGLQALFSLISVFVAVLIVTNLRRRTGVSINPSSIASIATLFNNLDMVREIADINPNTETSIIAQNMKGHRCIMAEYLDAYGQHHHGFLCINNYGLPETWKMLQGQQQGGHQRSYIQSKSGARMSARLVRSRVRKTVDLLLPVLLIGLLGVIIAYRLDTSNSGFNMFFGRGEFGPRFILTMAATLITIGVQSIEQEVRIKTPSRHLARRHASASNSILRTVNGTALTNVLSALRHRESFHAVAATTAAVLGDVLIIAVAGIPFNSAEIWPAFLASFYVSVSICSLMLLVVAWAFVWRAQNAKLHIPEEPNDVLVRVLMSLSGPGNRIRIMFDRLRDVDGRALASHCRSMDHTFYAAWVVDEEGRVVWCIERESESLLAE